MFKIMQSGNSLPYSWPVDQNSQFQPGMLAQLNTFGNNIVVGVSDGSCPIGVIDDVKSNAFTAPSIDEVIIVPAIGTGSPPRSVMDIKAELQSPNLVPSSFISNPIDVELIPRNGVILFPAGTLLNFDASGNGVPDSIRTVVSYTYQIPNIPGDDSTISSGRVTVWYSRLIGQTTMYETNVPYAVNCSLFCNENGLWTSRQATPDTPGIGICLAPPSSIFGTLEFLFL